MDEELRRKICRLVAGIVVSDDDLDAREDQFVDRLLADFGFPAGEREFMFPIIETSEAVAAMESMDDASKEAALTHLLEAACADGKIVGDQERDYLRTVAMTMGIDSDETDRMIAVRLSLTT